MDSSGMIEYAPPGGNNECAIRTKNFTVFETDPRLRGYNLRDHSSQISEP